MDILNLKIFADRAAASVEKIGLLIRGVPCTLNVQVLNRIGEAFDGDLSAYTWRFAVKESYNSNAPCLRADSVTVEDDTLTAIISIMNTTQLAYVFTEIDQIETLIAEFTGVIDDADAFVIQFEINVKNRVDPNELPPTPIEEYAKITYVDEQIEALKTDLEPQLEAIKGDTAQIILDVAEVQSKVNDVDTALVALSTKTTADKNEVLSAIAALGNGITAYLNTGA